jgi:hypothetical protein
VRVRRSSALILVGLVVAFAIVSTLWIASGDSHDEEAFEGRRVGPAGTGVTAVLPPGWTNTSGTDSFWMFKAERNPPPVDALDCPPGYLNVISVYIGEGNRVLRPSHGVVPRPAHFSADVGEMLSGDGDTCFVHFQEIAFSDAGRKFRVLIRIGKNTTHKQVQQAYSFLDSLVIKPRTP